MIEINCETSKYKVFGYISFPSFCKANKTYQTLIVNGRYVANNLISVALSNAYENFLMKGKFPVYVLNLELNYEDIDVNVHPSKMEVKFKDSKEIYNIFYSKVLETLNENNCPIDFAFSNSSDEKINIPSENNNLTTEEPSLKKIEGGFSFNALESISNELSNVNVNIPKYVENDKTSVLSSPENNFLVLNSKENSINKENISFADTNEDIMNNNIFETGPVKENKIQEELKIGLNYKLIGTLFNTYIVIESGENAYLIDQHAGHERLLYDKFIEQFETNKIVNQPLLVPYIFNVNEIEDELVENNLDMFKYFGFEIENFGRLTYKISSVPNLLNDINLQNFVDEILSNLTKVSANNELIKNKFAQMACKAAVKGGQNLSKEEIEILLTQIFSKKTTLLCPHGRPICVKLTKYEIEKMFKRIV